MKTSLAVAAIAALGLAGSASAKGNGNTSSNSGGAPSHHGSAPTATTTVAPHFSGIPHYSGGMPYRPTLSYRNGTRTFNYPAVGVSTLHHPTHSGGNTFSNAYALQHSGNLHRLSGLNTGGNTHHKPKT